MINLRDYQTTRGHKLKPRRAGPFEIVDKLSPVTFKVELTRKFKRLHPVFHASKLVPYTTSKIPEQNPKAGEPEEIDGHWEWEIEKILDSKRKGVKKKLEFLVRWKGFTQEVDSWEPEVNSESRLRTGVMSQF